MLLSMPAIRTNKGFSLVELIIVVAIFIVLATLAAPSYKEMMQNNQTRNAAESIQNGIQLARAEAVKRNATIRFILNGSNSAWCVTTGTTCPGTIQNRALTDGSSTNVAVTFSDTGPYVFNSLGAMTSPTPAAADGITRIGLANSSMSGLRNLQVAINVGGSTKMCDPSVSSTTDSRKCP